MNANTDTATPTGPTSDTTMQTSTTGTGSPATPAAGTSAAEPQDKAAGGASGQGGDAAGADKGAGVGGASDGKGKAAEKGAAKPGDPATPWQDALPKDLAENPLFRNYKTVEDALKAHLHLYKARGVPAERLLVLPDKPQDQAPEDWAALHKALGVPDDPNDYKIELAPEAAADTPELEKTLRDLGQKAKLQPGQMAVVIETLNALGKAADEAEVKAKEAEATATRAELDKEWGAAAEGNRRAIGKLLLDAHGGKLDEAALADLSDKVANNPAVARALAYAAQRMAEPGAPEGQGGGGQPGRQMTPAEATAGLNAFYVDKEKVAALNDKKHPQHTAVLEERKQLLAWQRGEKRPDQVA